MRGTILEVRASIPRRAVAVLREKLGKNSVSLFGDKVHVVTATPEESSRRVEQIIAGEKLELLGIRPVDPALEDVFVSVLSGGEEGSANE